MKTKRNMKIIIIAILNLTMFYSCVMDYKYSYVIRNNTNDTLLIELSDCASLNDSIYRFDEDILLMLKNSVGNDKRELSKMIENSTVVANIHGEKVFFDMDNYALPGELACANQWLFTIKDTLYIYAIKWQVAKKYSIEEIRAKKLYDRRTVTKKDFHDRVYDYKIEK